MKSAATVCTLTLLLAAPLASQCAAAAPPQQGRDGVAQLSAECEKAKYASCNSLGLMYEEGNGAEKDAKRAEELYRRACDGGHANGCTNLGVLYQNGVGVAKDTRRTSMLYKEARARGNLTPCSHPAAIHA